MDLNPEDYPLLSFLLSQLNPDSNSNTNSSQFQENLLTKFPHLNNPTVQSSLSQSIPNTVPQTLSLLQSLGPPPDPSAVAAAKSKITETDQVDHSKETEIYRAVVRLEELREECEKRLMEAEETVVGVYRSVVAEMEDTEEVDEEVVGILKAAAAESGRMERVELSGRQLRFLPEAFGKIRGLIELNLSNNQFEAIPDSIAGLRRLETLDVSSNLLKSLPDSIGLLLNLKVLNVSGNKLNALPESIALCHSLVEFDASFNNLIYLPKNMGCGLMSLEKLSIHLNKIRFLPSTICEMRSLRHLDAHFNELHGLPYTIGKLTNLEVLNVSSNFSDLKGLPETLGDLTNLRELDLSNNQIRALPDTFCRLKNLTKLNLDENPLIVPPMEIISKGVEEVKKFMEKRWLDIMTEEPQRSVLEANKQQGQTGWLAWGTSLLNNVVYGVPQSVAEYMGGGRRGSGDPFLDQQL